ncbi:unnamed protein product, partial [Closterium sp. NIES-54]
RAAEQHRSPAAEPSQLPSRPSRPSRPAVEPPELPEPLEPSEPPEPPSCPAVAPPLHLLTCPGPTYSYCAIGQTDSLFSILPLVSLLPRLLLLTALSAHSGPYAMLLHVLLCVATYRPLS